MAKPPQAAGASSIDQFGPHLNYAPPGGWQEESRTPAGPAGQDTLLLSADSSAGSS